MFECKFILSYARIVLTMIFDQFCLVFLKLVQPWLECV